MTTPPRSHYGVSAHLSHLPLSLVVGVMAVCLIPILLQAFQISLFTGDIDSSQHPINAYRYTIFSTLWIATALFTLFLAILHNSILRNGVGLTIGLTLFLGLWVDSTLVSGIDGLLMSQATVPKAGLPIPPVEIPWLMSRAYFGMLILVSAWALLKGWIPGSITSLWNNNPPAQPRSQSTGPPAEPSRKHLLKLTLILGGITLFYDWLIGWAVEHQQVALVFPNTWVPHPWNGLSLAIFLIGCCYLLPRLHQVYQSPAIHGWILSVMILAIGEVYITFGATAGLDNFRLVAFFLTIMSYGILACGLALDMVYAYWIQHHSLLSVDRQRQLMTLAHDKAVLADHVKSDFLLAAAQDLKTPLNGMLGVSTLMGNTPLNPDQQRFLTMIHQAGQSMLFSVNSIRDLARLENNQMNWNIQHFNLREVLTEITLMAAKRGHKKGVELIVHVDPEIPSHLMSDPDRLTQIVSNLLLNLVETTPSGYILMRVSLLDPVAEVQKAAQQLAAEENTETQQPSDESVTAKPSEGLETPGTKGVPEPTPPQNGEATAAYYPGTTPNPGANHPPFQLVFTLTTTEYKPQTTDKPGRERWEEMDWSHWDEEKKTFSPAVGSSLGLMVARGLIERMDGELWVEPWEDSGETLHFHVGVYPSNQPLKPWEELPTDKLEEVPVLVLEPNIYRLSSIMEQLLYWKMDAVPAESTDEALETLKKAAQQDNPFEIVILNSEMPDEDGFALSRRIASKKDWGPPKLLLYTTMELPDLSKKVERSRVDAVIPKPVNPNHLLTALVAMLDFQSVSMRHYPKLPEGMDPDTLEEKPPLRILLVDDNFLTQEILKTQLESEGHEVTVVHSATEAYQTLDLPLPDLPETPILTPDEMEETLKTLINLETIPPETLEKLQKQALAPESLSAEGSTEEDSTEPEGHDDGEDPEASPPSTTDEEATPSSEPRESNGSTGRPKLRLVPPPEPASPSSKADSVAPFRHRNPAASQGQGEGGNNEANPATFGLKLATQAPLTAVAPEGTEDLPFDLILIDTHLPDGDGFQAATHIRTSNNGQFEHLPLIGLLSNPEEGSRDTVFSMGMNGFIMKPFNREQLLNTLYAVAYGLHTPIMPEGWSMSSMSDSTPDTSTPGSNPNADA